MKLTKREHEVLELLGQECLTNSAIAHRLGLAELTVKVYLHNIYIKLGFDKQVGCNSRSLAVKYVVMGMMLTFAAFAQSTGTITTSSVTSVTGTAGPVVCTLTSTTPAPASGVHVTCTSSGVLALTMDAVIAPGTNGMVGGFTVGLNTVSWLVTKPSTSEPYTWQMAANGKGASGVF